MTLKAISVIYLLFSSELTKKKLCGDNEAVLNAVQYTVFSSAMRRSGRRKNRKRIDKRTHKG